MSLFNDKNRSKQFGKSIEKPIFNVAKKTTENEKSGKKENFASAKKSSYRYSHKKKLPEQPTLHNNKEEEEVSMNEKLPRYEDA